MALRLFSFGGAGAGSFKTIQTPAGTSPVASGPNDVLTLTSVDGSVTITGNSATDTVDFSVSGSSIGGFISGSVIFADSIGTLSEDNANFFYNPTTHFLGLGTTSPVATLDIRATMGTTTLTGADGVAILAATNTSVTTDTSNAAANRRVLYSRNLTITPTSTMTFQNYGDRLIVQVTSGNAQNITNSIFGSDSQVLIGGTGTYASVRALRYQATNQSSGVITALQGISIPLSNSSTGSVGTWSNVDATVTNSNASGVITTVTVYSVNNITNAGTITTLYGYYVGDITTGTQTSVWAFYNSDANAPSYFAGKFGINGVTAPTAFLHLGAGTATANTAPLKFNSGTLLTTAEAGAFEFLTDKFYGTITTGAARKEFIQGDNAITDGVNIVVGTSTGTKFGTATTQKIGFYNATPVVQQTDGAALTNNVTSGGTTDTIANYTDLTLYANDAAAIRNNIYQLARKLKIVDDALRTYGLLS